MKIPFVKYHGAGNDFIMIDDRAGKIGPLLTTDWIARACHRHFGVGADGLILLQPGKDGADFFMKYYNSDGLTSSFCGNGGRCIAAYAGALGLHAGACKFLGTDGWHFAQMDGQGGISLSMQDVASIQTIDDNTFVLNTGSPHYVQFTNNIDVLDVRAEGRAVRRSDAYKQEGINVNFVEIIAPGEIKLRTYERGVEDETLACGTGVVASAIASCYANDPQQDQWLVHARGGDLHVRFKHEEGEVFTEVRLIGPAEEVFRGELEI